VSETVEVRIVRLPHARDLLIDADYSGELQVILANIGPDLFAVSRGMRIAQPVIALIQHEKLVESNSLNATERAAGGLGSTGFKSKTG
jgi:dUTP pyrophosphatase